MVMMMMMDDEVLVDLDVGVSVDALRGDRKMHGKKTTDDFFATRRRVTNEKIEHSNYVCRQARYRQLEL
jgi:hypothetical protein